jgi:DNA-binding HxlR family transcriptional regulator
MASKEDSMSATWNVFNDQCPTRLVLARIADKWTVMIVLLLSQKRLRFGELKREIPGISQKMLTQTLRALERDGLVVRTVYAEVPPRVEYSLTGLGKTLVGILTQIRDWSETHIEAVLAAQKAFDHKTSDQAASATTNGAKVVRLSSRAR